MKIKITVSICALLMLSFNAQAKTLHVAKWGVDDPSSGSTSQPFETIGAALMNASKNDKIVVQPGIYEESATLDFIADTHDGVKLESVAGRHGTVIDSSGSDTSEAIEVYASKVRIGKKRKGFTIRCAPTEEAIYIDGSTSNVRVEYNRMVGCDNDTIDVGGTRTVVRGNWIESVGYAIYGNGCVNCLIDSNIAFPGSEGFELESLKGGSVMRNLLMGGEGIHAGDDSEKIKLKDNVVIDLTGANPGIDVNSNAPSGALIQGNIVSGSGAEGIEADQNLADSNDISIKNNLVLGSQLAGIHSSMNADGVPDFRVSMDGNTLVQNDVGFNILNTIDIKSFKNNNTYASVNADGLRTEIDVMYKSHFWGDASGPDFDGGVDAHDAIDDNGNAVTGSDKSKPNAFKARQAAGL